MALDETVHQIINTHGSAKVPTKSTPPSHNRSPASLHAPAPAENIKVLTILNSMQDRLTAIDTDGDGGGGRHNHRGRGGNGQGGNGGGGNGGGGNGG